VTRYRALRPGAGPRSVSIGEGDGYVVVREDATGGWDRISGGVVLIDHFDVPAGEEDAFLAGWDDTRAELAAHRGYLGARLYRADARFVEVARWSSPLMVQRAGLQGALYLPV
jgi:hypothetical protein